MAPNAREAAMRDRFIEALLSKHRIKLDLESSRYRTVLRSRVAFPGNKALDRYRVSDMGMVIGWAFYDGSSWLSYNLAAASDYPELLGPFPTRYAAVRAIGSLADLLPPDVDS